MKKQEYFKMIDEAIEEFKGMNINYAGLLLCLKGNHRTFKNNYVTKEQETRARERIDLLKSLKNLNLLK